MKLDFDYINRVASKLHADFVADGGNAAYREGRHVFNIEFDPSTGSAKSQVQWPTFRDLVANEADCPATHRSMHDNYLEEPWMHWECVVQGVKITACLAKSDIIKELKSLGVYETYKYDDIEDLFNAWQSVSGWKGW